MNTIQKIVYWSDRWLPLFTILEENRARWFVRRFRAEEWFSAGGGLLDIGSGVGDVTKAIQSATRCNVVGMDNVDYRRLGNRINPKNPYLLGDGRSLPFKHDSFDGVLLIWALHHMQNPFEVLSEAFRVMRKGGRIVILEDLIDQSRPFTKRLVRAYDQVINLELRSHAERNFSLTELDKIVRENFSVRGIELSEVPASHKFGVIKFGILRYEKL